MNTLLPNPETPIIPDPKLARRKRLSIYAASAGILIILGAAIGGYIYQNRQPACTNCTSKTASPSASAPTPTPTPKLVASAINGVMVAPDKANLRPLAVIIENHPDARPQSGLGQASLVYEAIAEGGITRFLAVFADPTQTIKVGPVRSARTYFVDYVEELQAFFGHVGGNMDALDRIKAENVLDLDQFSVGAPTYNREYSRNVALEHTMYTTTSNLWKYATDTKKWPQNADISSLPFKDDLESAKRPASQTVDVSVSSSQFSVHWDYDPTKNEYKRSMGGTLHIDADNGQQITAKTIILQTVSRQATTTRIGEDGWIYGTRGSGTATIIQDGTVKTATWKREGDNRTRYYDENGKEISLNRGRIWIQLTHSDSTVRHQP